MRRVRGCYCVCLSLLLQSDGVEGWVKLSAANSGGDFPDVPQHVTSSLAPPPALSIPPSRFLGRCSARLPCL